jgi:hypothetical protein
MDPEQPAYVGVEWVQLAQDMVQSRATVNTLIKLLVP